MSKLKLAFVHAFVDRHGKSRYYFRKRGYKRVPLPGLPGSDEFMITYQSALAGELAPRVEIGADRTKPGTVAAAVAGYFASAAFHALAKETRRTRKNILERFRAENGDKRIALLQRVHLDRMVAAKARTPGAAKNFLKTIRGLIRHCILNGLRKDDPTTGIKVAAAKTSGFYTWTEDDIAVFEARHPIGSRARLALALLLYTAQRRSDVIRMGRQHVRNGAVSVVQQKTGAALTIPLHPALKAILDATPVEHLTFLTTKHGEPFTSAGFGNWFRDCCNDAGLPKGVSAHGLRKAACRRLAEAGCSAHEIAAISGHATLKEVQRYTAAADQVRMARSAMGAVEAAFPIRKRTPRGKPK